MEQSGYTIKKTHGFGVSLAGRTRSDPAQWLVQNPERTQKVCLLHVIKTNTRQVGKTERPCRTHTHTHSRLLFAMSTKKLIPETIFHYFLVQFGIPHTSQGFDGRQGSAGPSGPTRPDTEYSDIPSEPERASYHLIKPLIVSEYSYIETIVVYSGEIKTINTLAKVL